MVTARHRRKVWKTQSKAHLKRNFEKLHLLKTQQKILPRDQIKYKFAPPKNFYLQTKNPLLGGLPLPLGWFKITSQQKKKSYCTLGFLTTFITIMHRSIFWFTIPPSTPGVGHDFRVKAQPSGLIFGEVPGVSGPGYVNARGVGPVHLKNKCRFFAVKKKLRLKLVFYGDPLLYFYQFR